METVKRLLETVRKHKVITCCLIAFLLIILSVVMPFIKVKSGITDLSLKEINKIIYAKYEVEPLASDIQILKEADSQQNKEIDEFKNMMDNGKVKIYPSEVSTSEMIFIYLEDGRVVNAYVNNDMLGFNYGKYWITLDGVQSWIDNMEIRDKIKVKDQGLDTIQ